MPQAMALAARGLSTPPNQVKMDQHGVAAIHWPEKLDAKTWAKP